MTVGYEPNTTAVYRSGVGITSTDWSTIAVGCSALATAAMAIYTANLASKTKSLADTAEKEATAVVEQGKAIAKQADAVSEQARAAGEQLVLTRQSARAYVQPWLTLGHDREFHGLHMVRSGGMMTGDVPAFLVYHDDQHLFVELVLRNVGSGLAIVDPVVSHVVGWPSDRSNDAGPMNYSSGTIDNPILPSGEEVVVFFDVGFSRWMIDYETLTGQHRNEGEFFIDVVYGDVLGNERTRARFHAARNAEHNAWSVFEIHYFAPPEATEAALGVRF